jgi:cardiolipin synthase
MAIDGTVGFIGGAGIARHWDAGDRNGIPWRDMMFKVHGPVVTGLQSTFAENWLESSGEILAHPDYYAATTFREQKGEISAMVVMSTPTAGRSSRTRILFQVLLAAARQSIDIHSPYFLPDRSATAELARAARDRSVRVRVIVPGSTNNHPMSRLASRRRYGPLLEAGVEIYEYQPGMIHTKSLTVDLLWAVVGSTNFDSRSFDLNDEVNMVVVDRHFTQQISNQFAADLLQSRRVTLAEWLDRTTREHVASNLGRVFERQE